MKPVLFVLSASLLSLSIAACDRSDSPVLSSEAVDPPPRLAAQTAMAGTRVVHSKVGSGKGKAMALVAGQSIAGSIRPGSDGQLAAFGVRIGNYFNSSDGSLGLTLCVDGNCQDSDVSLSGSKDNDYLLFQLPESVAISATQTIDYTLTRSRDATNRVAVWAYPAAEHQAGLVDVQGTRTDLVPRLTLYFRQ